MQEPGVNRIIRKSVKRRERMARIARLRHRREKNVFFAQVQDLNLPYKHKPQNAIYETVLGFMISETDNGLDRELCYLNENYSSNAVIVQNDIDKLLCVKLHKNNQNKGNVINDQILDEWERRDDPYWGGWVGRYKELREGYRHFINKHKEKFEANTLDEESLIRQQAYIAKCDELRATKACFELKVRVTEKGCMASEILFNSSFINTLNYDFEEFIQKILVEGLPRLGPSHKLGLRKIPVLPTNIDYLFNNSIEFTVKDAKLLSKNLNFKKTDFNILAGGYFVKNARELIFLFSLNNSETLLEGESNNRPIFRLYLEQQMVYDAERKYFLEKYYGDKLPQHVIKPKETCRIRAIVNEIEEETEESNKEIIQRVKFDEDIMVKENEELYESAIIEEPTTETPVTDYLTQLMPLLQRMKYTYEKQHKMLSQMLQEK